MERWTLDIEIFENLLLIVAKKLGTKEYRKFVVHEGGVNDLDNIMEFLGQRYTFIGYNIVEFDGQILEYIWRHGVTLTVKDIYDFVQRLIDRPIEDKFNLPFKEWELSFNYIDVFKLNHYDGKKVSLKWLEFTTRWGKLADMPVKPDASIPKSKIPEVATYCTNDVNITEDFYLKCLNMVELREELAKRYSEARIINMSDSSIGAYIFENILIKEYGFKKANLKKGSYYDNIKVKDCLVDYIQFEAPEFKEVHNKFINMVYTDVKNRGIKDDQHAQAVLYEDMVFVYGSGGLHACYKAGEYYSDEEYIIKSIDVKSYYPNLSIKNSFYPKHIGPQFCTIYKSVYDERQTHEKGSAINYAFKIALNSVYGKSNSAYSIFYDPAYTLKITINGQLLLSMLAEGVAPLGRLLMVNTDGLEILIPRSKEEELENLCSEWEILTGLELEHNSYNKMVIRDVNNYLAVDVKNKPKRKGIFEIYEDYTEEGGKPHQYHKSPDATIIPEALFNYYTKGIAVEETIANCNNIFDFCYGIKKQRGFDHLLITADKKGVIDIEKRDDKVIRYYICKEGANIYKFWADGRKTSLVGVNRGQLVKLAMNIKNPELELITKGTKAKPSELIVQYDVDKEHYIKECYALIDLISARTRDNAYNEYMKKAKKEGRIIDLPVEAASEEE